MFQAIEGAVSFPRQEEEIMRFWKDRGIYEKSLTARAGAKPFVFFEGPPTANGLPHPGHCLTRAIKDLFPRYKTMRGYRCERKAGWDTHGLPVEVEVCKELGIHSKEQIEDFGVEPFIHRCLESVFRYTQQWEELTERLGFWVNLEKAYVTYHQSYVESVWWALANFFNRGLLYQGHKIVWWWAQGGTALSSGEVSQGYKQVGDPSVYVRFPIVVDVEQAISQTLPHTDLLVWTTTPWTLPSNQFAAVHPELTYAVCEVTGGEGVTEARQLIVAEALVETIAKKVGKKFTVVRTLQGTQLLGLRYLPPFDYYYKKDGQKRGKLRMGGESCVAWRVIAADFVTTDSGTGLVHEAPAFGEVDFDVLVAEREKFADGEGPELICAVLPNGTFDGQIVPEYAGRWVKEADGDIWRRLRDEGKLFHQEQYLHDYPFCWRADQDPLIQYPRKSWFIRTTKFKERMLENNAQIQWLPEYIRDGRFGNFLETNVDWALSRERYWGTPLPIWVCEKTGKMEAVASYHELLAKPGMTGVEVWEKAKAADPELPEDLKVHKPYIDAITYDSPFAEGAKMHRVPEVIDCWFDSGSMPFAQWGYPHAADSAARMQDQFPADFISEAQDQTRGWFYSQLAISTLLFGEEPTEIAQLERVPYVRPFQPKGPHPFKSCIVLGLMLGEDGLKMSKSKKNYPAPDLIFDKYGADAMRWYFYANQTPWTSIRYSEQAIKDSIPEFLLRLWNCYSFFVIYANIDGFDPAKWLQNPGQLRTEELAAASNFRPASQRSELDRWMLSELDQTIQGVTESLDVYQTYEACGKITAFVDALSNWYVRRSRDRFWANGLDQDKLDAYWTLYECLLSISKTIAPMVPFLAETMWQNLAVAPFSNGVGATTVPESVHLCDWIQPVGGAESRVDAELSRRMSVVRDIVSQGRAARVGAKLKVRQPLQRVEVILTDTAEDERLRPYAALIAEELNVKEVEFIERSQGEKYIAYSVLPDLKRLGPKLGKKLPAVRKALATANPAELLAQLNETGSATLALDGDSVMLTNEDLQIRLQAQAGWAAAQGDACVVVLATELSAELLAEGVAREIIHFVQGVRKEMKCEYTDCIRVTLATDDVEIVSAVRQFAQTIQSETLASHLGTVPMDAAPAVSDPRTRTDAKIGTSDLVIVAETEK
ncbi:MAG: isoleucine--tRNA ligase [Thermoguttaceae bacterium]|nr:isoleucine--tRNA ligase [Thermoguttaceae bacterium]